MALLKYLKPAKDRLPDLRGFLQHQFVRERLCKLILEVQQLPSDDKKEKARSLQ